MANTARLYLVHHMHDDVAVHVQCRHVRTWHRNTRSSRFKVQRESMVTDLILISL